MESFDKFNEDSKVLWNDRKRILGMPISFTKYQLGDSRLTKKSGLIKTEVDETLLYRVLDVKMTQTLGQKILRVGTVTIYCADKSTPILELKNVKEPDKVRRFLSKLVEEKRDEKRVTGKEMFGTADEENECSHIDFGDGF